MGSKERIFEAVFELVDQKGLEGTTTALIARTAGVATGTLFYHFHDKGAILDATYRHLLDQFAWCLVGVFDYPDNVLDRQFKRALRLGVDYWLRHQRRAKFASQILYSTYFTPDLALYHEQFMKKQFEFAWQSLRRMGRVQAWPKSFLLEGLFRQLLILGTLAYSDDDERNQISSKGVDWIWSGMSNSRTRKSI